MESLSETAPDKLVIRKPLSRASKERGHSRAFRPFNAGEVGHLVASKRGCFTF